MILYVHPPSFVTCYQSEASTIACKDLLWKYTIVKTGACIHVWQQENIIKFYREKANTPLYLSIGRATTRSRSATQNILLFLPWNTECIYKRASLCSSQSCLCKSKKKPPLQLKLLVQQQRKKLGIRFTSADEITTLHSLSSCLQQWPVLHFQSSIFAKVKLRLQAYSIFSFFLFFFNTVILSVRKSLNQSYKQYFHSMLKSAPQLWLFQLNSNNNSSNLFRLYSLLIFHPGSRKRVKCKKLMKMVQLLTLDITITVPALVYHFGPDSTKNSGL